MVPSLDFNREGDIDIPILKKDTEIREPREHIDPEFNPFEAGGGVGQERQNLQHWESLYRDLEQAESSVREAMQESTDGLGEPGALLQFKQRYILLAVKSGLMVVDQKRAHERILFERYLDSIKNREPLAQQELFPSVIQLDAADHALIMEIINDICGLGFDIRDAGEYRIEVRGIPAETDLKDDPDEWILKFLGDFKEREADIRDETGQKLAAAMAGSSAIPSGKVLRPEEMREIMDQLFACSEPATSPDGKAVFRILPLEDIEKIFN
jgi:DNA mismatch repair protein MutL